MYHRIDINHGGSWGNELEPGPVEGCCLGHGVVTSGSVVYYILSVAISSQLGHSVVTTCSLHLRVYICDNHSKCFTFWRFWKAACIYLIKKQRQYIQINKFMEFAVCSFDFIEEWIPQCSRPPPQKFLVQWQQGLLVIKQKKFYTRTKSRPWLTV